MLMVYTTNLWWIKSKTSENPFYLMARTRPSWSCCTICCTENTTRRIGHHGCELAEQNWGWNNKPEMVTCAEDLPMPSELVTWGILWIRNRTLLRAKVEEKATERSSAVEPGAFGDLRSLNYWRTNTILYDCPLPLLLVLIIINIARITYTYIHIAHYIEHYRYQYHSISVPVSLCFPLLAIKHDCASAASALPLAPIAELPGTVMGRASLANWLVIPKQNWVLGIFHGFYGL